MSISERLPQIKLSRRNLFRIVGVGAVTVGGVGLIGATRVLSQDEHATLLNGQSKSGSLIEEITISEEEKRQVDTLKQFLHSYVRESFNSLDLESPAQQRRLLDKRRSLIQNGVRWELMWNLPTEGVQIPLRPASKNRMEVDVTVRSPKIEVGTLEEYRLEARGLDSITTDGLNTKFNSGVVSPTNLDTVARKVFILPPELRILFKKPTIPDLQSPTGIREINDGIEFGEGTATDSLGNTISFTINSGGSASLTVRKQTLPTPAL